MTFSEKQLFIDNNMIYEYYRNRLITMALSQFIYEGLPDTCDRLYFEKCLLYNGKAALMKSKLSGDWLSLGYTNDSNLDVYGYPTRLYGVGINTSYIETDEWVQFYDNPTKNSIMPYIDLYARLLWECHQTVRMQLDKQNNPLVYEMTKNQQLTYENLESQRRGFKSVFFVRKRNKDEGETTLLNPVVPYIGLDLLATLKSLWSEALGMLGIAPSGSIDKKERLISDEVEFNKEEYIIARNSRELLRKEGIDKFNNRYGFNVSVHLANIDTSLPLDMFPNYHSISTNVNEDYDDE